MDSSVSRGTRTSLQLGTNRRTEGKPALSGGALAQRMCDAYEAAQRGGEGAAGESGMLIDAASLRIFQGVLERARLTGRA